MHEFLLGRREPDDLVYAVVDAARDWELARSAWTHFDLEGFSLLGWDTPQHMLQVVPYLVPLKFQAGYPYAGSQFLDLFADRMDNSVGIVLMTRVGRHRLFEHLADIMNAKDERGTRYIFRYWDPRVLRAYLPTCRTEESRQFFGPIREILAPARTEGNVLTYSRAPEGFDVVEEPLRPAVPAAEPRPRE